MFYSEKEEEKNAYWSRKKITNFEKKKEETIKLDELIKLMNFANILSVACYMNPPFPHNPLPLPFSVPISTLSKTSLMPGKRRDWR